MSRELLFFVPGRPQAWERTEGSGRRRFKADLTKAAQQRCQQYARAAVRHHGFERLTGPVRLWVRAVFKRPDRRPKKVSADDWAVGEPMVRPCTPDADNVVKLVSDALNGIVYVDDAQVVDERSWTEWGVEGEESGLYVLVQPVETMPTRYRAELWRQAVNAYVPDLITPWIEEACARCALTSLPWRIVNHISGDVLVQSESQPLEFSS